MLSDSLGAELLRTPPRATARPGQGPGVPAPRGKAPAELIPSRLSHQPWAGSPLPSGEVGVPPSGHGGLTFYVKAPCGFLTALPQGLPPHSPAPQVTESAPPHRAGMHAWPAWSRRLLGAPGPILWKRGS